MRNRLQNFMNGRYGNDRLNQVLCIAALILAVVDIFVNIAIIWYIAVVLLVIVFWRMLSRNTTQRAIENDRFLNFISRFRRGGGRRYGGGYGNGGYGGYGGYGNGGYGGRNANGGQRTYSRQESAERKRAQRQDKRYYKYFNCPNCNQKVRVPKGKGKIEIACPKCHTSFIRKT